ncbi:MucR family transcriptional regulator [Desulfovibrio sp. DV]|uniref:MucR family transcriptional regulator n=1 Tax=Desulfovibrio sp. DV TaxID=1844708 RepID=UPI00094BB384|nr:MucR family transcriptional regulator [Desulfovibrio sp. DV]
MDNDVSIFRAIMELHPALAIDDQIHLATKVMKGLAKAKADIAMGNTVVRDDDGGTADNKQREHPYTKADLKVNPMSALKGEKATCCLCGKDFDVISKAHLSVSHKITPEQYRELCGYAPDTKLMTDAQLQKKKDILNKAKPWEKTDRWQGKQAKQAEQDTATKAADGSGTDQNTAPKESPKAVKSDTKPQNKASAKPEKDDKGESASAA